MYADVKKKCKFKTKLLLFYIKKEYFSVIITFNSSIYLYFIVILFFAIFTDITSTCFVFNWIFLYFPNKFSTATHQRHPAAATRWARGKRWVATVTTGNRVTSSRAPKWVTSEAARGTRTEYKCKNILYKKNIFLWKFLCSLLKIKFLFTKYLAWKLTKHLKFYGSIMEKLIKVYF